MDVSDIFYFFLLGGGEGGVQGAGRGGGRDDFYWKSPGGGGLRADGGGGASGREGVCGELEGGGLNNFFFSGPKFPPRYNSDGIAEPWLRWIQEGFKKALLQNPQEVIRGQIFSEMIRIQVRKSELRPLRTKSQSYSRADPPESEPNRPEKEPESDLGASTDIKNFEST